MLLFSQGIEKRKTESNGERRGMSEDLHAILPGHLMSVVFTLLSSVVTKFQKMLLGEDKAGKVPQTRALLFLQAGQQRLSEQIHAMSSEEHLLYAHMIHTLSKSLIVHEWSLEQLESSLETHALTHLLLGMARAPEESLLEERVDDDLFFAVVPVLSSVVHEGGLVLYTHPTLMEAFQRLDLAFDSDGAHLGIKSSLDYSSYVEKLFLAKSVVSDGSLHDGEAGLTEKSENILEDPSHNGRSGSFSQSRNSVVGQPNDNIEKRSKGRNTVTGNSDHGRTQQSCVTNATGSELHRTAVNDALESLRVMTGATVHNVPQRSKEWDLLQGLKQAFVVYSKSIKKLKLLTVEARDGYKCIARSEIDLSHDLYVGTTGVGNRMELWSFAYRYNRQTTTEEGGPVLWSASVNHYTDSEWGTAVREYLVKDVKKKYLGEMKGLLSAPMAGGEPTCCRNKTECQANRSNLVMTATKECVVADTQGSVGSMKDPLETRQESFAWRDHLLDVEEWHQVTELKLVALINHCIERSSTIPTQPPQPPPPSSWCWKRRLESVADVLHYVKTASQATLEELDSECKETICHAVASVYSAETAVNVIQILHNNVSPTLFGVQDRHGNTPLHNAVTAGDVMIAKELVILRPSSVCTTNYEHNTPLDIAMSHKNDEMVDYLLRGCVSSDPHNTATVKLLESSLAKAMRNGYTHFLKIVLELHSRYGLAIDFEPTDSHGHTAWHYLSQSAPAVRVTVAEMLQKSSLNQTLANRLLKALGVNTPPPLSNESSRSSTPDIVPLFQSHGESVAEDSAARGYAVLGPNSEWDREPAQEAVSPRFSLSLSTSAGEAESEANAATQENVVLECSTSNVHFKSTSKSETGSPGVVVHQEPLQDKTQILEDPPQGKIGLLKQSQETDETKLPEATSPLQDLSLAKEPGKEPSPASVDMASQTITKHKRVEEAVLVEISLQTEATVKGPSQMEKPCSREEPPLAAEERETCSREEPPLAAEERETCSREEPPLAAEERETGSREEPPLAAEERETCSREEPPLAAEERETGSREEPPLAAEERETCSREEPPLAAEERETGSREEPPLAAEERETGSREEPPLAAEERETGSREEPPLAAEERETGSREEPPLAAEERETGSREEPPLAEERETGSREEPPLAAEETDSREQKSPAVPGNNKLPADFEESLSVGRTEKELPEPTPAQDTGPVQEALLVGEVTTCAVAESSPREREARAVCEPDLKSTVMRLKAEGDLAVGVQLGPQLERVLGGLTLALQPAPAPQATQATPAGEDQDLKPMSSREPSQPHVLSEFQELQRKYDALVVEFGKFKETCTSCDDSLISSEFTDSSSSFLNTPDPHAKANARLYVASTEEEEEEKLRTIKPLIYAQPHTDSSNTPSPEKLPIYKKRRKKKLSPQRLCTITSDSDSGDCFKIRQRRPRESLATHFRTYCFSQSECDYSSPVSGDEHSSSDSAVGGMFPSDSQVDNQLALPSASLLESLPGWKLCARETKRKFRQKNTNLDKFFTPNGELDMKLFMPWLCSIVNQSGGYKHVISVIPQHFFTAFGFSRLRHKRLTPKEKKIAHAIFCFVKNTKQHIPERVKENLAVLKKVLEAGVFRGKKPRNNAPLRVTPKPLPQTRTHNESTPHEIEPHPQTHEGRHRYEGDSVTDGVAGPSPTDPQSRTPPTSESSAGVSVLDFASTSNPLDVICTHMKKFGSCCPRHDIRNIVTMGTTFPASDAFGPKRRYCTIKDLHSNPGHSQFDSTQKLSAQSSSKRRCYRNGESHQVMFDNRGALLTQLHPPRESQTLAETASPHPSLSSSKLRPQTLSHTHHQSKVTSDITTGSTYHQETSVVETLQANPEPSRRQTSVVETLQTNPEQNRRVDVATHIPLFDSTIVPEDHKQRLRSTAELLHAQDYTRILTLSYDGDPPSFLPPDLRIPYVFITGLAYYKLSNHKKSIQYFAQCLRLADECRRKGDITICNIYIGDIEFAKRRYTEAAGRYQSALESYSRESVAVDFQMVMPTRSAVWLKCGSAFKNASRVGAAVAAYEKAIELASSKKDELSAHTSLGNLYQGIGENGRAVKEYEAAIELAQELKDNVSLGWNHGNLGNALLGLHQRDKALHHLFKALDMAVDYETTPQAIGRAYNNLGTAYQSLNELGKAEEHYDLALSQAIYGNDIPGQARVYGNIGNLQMLNKQYDRAVPHYTEVMRLSQDKATITTAHHNRGCAYYDWAEKKKQASMPQDGVHGRENDMHGLQDVARGGKRPTSCLEIEVKGRGHSRLQADIASDTTSAAANDDQSPAPDSHFKVSLHGPDFEDCEEIYRPYDVPEAIQKYYLQGTRDLEYVIKHHEENFSGIKGSPKGLSLSVSLFETNSRTFHRMQDCLVHLEGEEHATRFRDALHVAEKSRARTLGELMMKRRGPQLTKFDLQSPPTLENMETIVGQQSCPVIYLSYTGERLLGWLLYPTPGTQTCSINMFEVPLSDNEFDGKSLDYHLRYSLNEQLVEKSFEMYKPFDHERDKTEPLEKLYDLVARPVMKMLEHLDEENEEKMKVAGRQQHKHEQKTEKKTEVRKIIVIPDSYTNLLPLTCTFDKTTRKFWGDHFYFQIMPSLLTMGILDQLPTVSVSIPVQYQQMLCVVGNPNIPRFKFNNEEWDLGKLPHATREAEWVSHILQCNPILHEQATKDAVMMRVMNAKVIHLATHGSAVAGFLAFAGISSSSSEAVDAKRVLIYPDEVESLNISPALVVLSSCDSGRGVFKADGIQGMARAFILAGAQAVLTALWRVPDESACIFMQFFYQYLVEGMRGTEALHKAILCLRCFSKYSQYIHWSGYQLTGREFQFNVSQTSARAELSTRLGVSSIFPRLEILKELKKAFLESPRLPTDVQVSVCTHLCLCTHDLEELW